MRLQVLDIGELQQGKSTTGREWARKTVQVFTEDKVAGNIPVYGELDELNAIKANGLYDATVRSAPGNNGRIELRITKLTQVKQA